MYGSSLCHTYDQNIFYTGHWKFLVSSLEKFHLQWTLHKNQGSYNKKCLGHAQKYVEASHKVDRASMGPYRNNDNFHRRSVAHTPNLDLMVQEDVSALHSIILGIIIIIAKE